MFLLLDWWTHDCFLTGFLIPRFDLPEPKVQVSFFNGNLSFVFSSVIVVVINFPHFHILFRGHYANINQT